MTPDAFLLNAGVQQALDDGAVYVDVRTPEEFALGHVPGAFNLPWALGSLAGLTDNPDFGAVAAANFNAERRLVLGCRSSARATKAYAALTGLGFSALAIHREGWEGNRDAFGRLTPGWSLVGLPQAHARLPGRDYPALLQNTQPQLAQGVAAEPAAGGDFTPRATEDS
jgi:rhodanese-related sulfurtransferase